MSKEITPEKIDQEINRLSKRWKDAEVDVPEFTVKEIARRMGTKQYFSFARRILSFKNSGNKNSIELKAQGNKEVDEGNLQEKTIEASPYKKAVNQAKYRSRAPGGGPVVKRRVDEKDLLEKRKNLGAARLIIISKYQSSEDYNSKRRLEIKQALEKRWEARVNRNDNQLSTEFSPKLKKYIDVVEKYNLFSKDGGMTRSFRLSADVFSLNQNLFDQITDIQNIFYAPGGIYSNIAKPPAITRIDLGITPDDKLKIFEVEGDKTSGFGYSAIADLLKDKNPVLPGIPDIIAKLVGKKSLGIPLGERFYYPEMYALANILKEYYQLDVKAIDKKDLEKYDLLLNWPQKWGRYQTNNILIPPNNMLGDKSYLELISKTNPQINKYLPTSFTITKENFRKAKRGFLNKPDAFIIKKTLSSGGSGVALTQKRGLEFLSDAEKFRTKYLIQEKIQQKTFEFSFIEPGENNVKKEFMYTRIEAYISKLGLASVLVTARPELPVQGAVNSIQIPAIVKI